jgi:transposase-like protein
MLAILKEYNVKPAEDINHALKDLFGGLLQEAPEAVLDAELGCEKNGQRPEGTGNRRNGHTEKSVRTEHGELELAVPRDRTREFHPLIVKKRHKEITASFNIKMGKRFPAFGISACLIL